ncbi:hypothetical protein SAMN03159306_05389 [Pseudomonas sp. NFACC48-1]|nr:hypothetical protein SAMN03159405_04237 [Pseudomonas sp. NFACC44-2]SDA89689.1 hypothetical protein SAMN03159429_05633 [Pseudomonas sp. NFACC51]SDW44012.1 hypothetical protein SAMN03159474_00872 [Pseudomonas sp. NFACC08-1]SFI15350.1 hypothetical protein SAMN03159302_03537 [Pseudomonas sp. NFACC54]SFT28300.1 hypothetical protein SAMN03159306_05389 [Pseudomonas sp. NFACC48-1]
MRPIKVEHARYSSKTSMDGTHRALPGISNGKCTEASIDGEGLFLHFALQQNLTQTEATHRKSVNLAKIISVSRKLSPPVLLRRNQCVTAWGRE